MSFRHTYVTEFLYKATQKEELDKIEEALKEFGSVIWQGHDNMGYFHGVIGDLDGFSTKIEYEEILEKLEKVGVKIKIVFE